MRLDKYLKVSRIIKRRTVAKEACDAGRVTVNGRPAKASADVKEGDVLEIQFGTKPIKVEVLSVKETVKKKPSNKKKILLVESILSESDETFVRNLYILRQSINLLYT